MYEEIEKRLLERGISAEVRRAIREAKICIIDDKIEDLKSLVEGLKKEGYTHIVEKSSITSINELVEGDFDLIVLDLTGVAASVHANDGFGVLGELKRVQPATPVLVVSGTTTTPDKTVLLRKADLIRAKPVMPAELASDVEELLRGRNDELWGGLIVLRELNKITADVKQKLSWIELLKLNHQKRSIERKLRSQKPGIASHILRISSLVYQLGTVAVKIISIAKGFGFNA